ncbi:class I SAM-dependent methyltransferase [Erythrobacter aurantius]|uniref:class I SAM-dependent methyltransferase n=1 Tax=Erythrobacter aurantius TaxID=2909249 RepID=UPI0020793200|nr:methyltransferase domain-containing protein [Erythrobacter aurantius]
MGSEAQEPLKGEDWAGEMGERWLANLDRFEAMIAPIGEALLARAAYAPGERVVDIGPGGGATTRAIARLVGPDGEAVGVDIAPMLVAEAERRAKAEGVANASFVCADAATARPDGAPFDRLHSRFGSMFFEDPHGAFANLRAMLQPKGRVDLAVWGPPRDNAWMMEMMGVVRAHVEVPPAEPRAPGPFAFEDLGYLAEVLDSGGFGMMDVEAYEGLQAIGGAGTSPEEAVRFVLSSLGVGRVLAEQPEAIRAAASADMLALFERHYQPDKGVMLGCKVWLVSAIA